MSIDPDRIYKKPFHRRNDSGELDVFEAARYFSGATEISGYNGASFTQKREDHSHHGWRGGGGGRRISLDMPLTNSLPSQTHHMVEKQVLKEKKNKQPSSPGGRLASFLNSLFNQTSSKKKKSKSTTTTTTQSLKDEDESPGGGRRKRRSSISHFRSASAADSKSVYSSTTDSGFRTPPPYPHTPAKHVVFLTKYKGHDEKPISLHNGVCDDKKSTIYAGLDEEFKFTHGFPEKINGFSEKDRKFNEVGDDGDDSDSSSDLFELENYDLGCYSSGLPVYETTHMDSIKRGAPISNGA